MKNPVISVTGIKKSFKDNIVLKGVNFEVGRGEIFALLGANGSGKTTIVNILSTLMKPDEGNGAVCGWNVRDQSDEVRQVISLTGQFSALDGMLTGKENLMMIGKLRGVAHPKQEAEHLLERFSLTDAGNRCAEHYSGGMKRRLDIAMSLLGTPQVIFLDEPTTGLDPESRMEVWEMIKELAGRGTTIFLTTQYLEEAEHLADRISILHGGEIITTGTLAALKEMFPPAKVEYIEKQPTLEEIFLAVIGRKEKV